MNLIRFVMILLMVAVYLSLILFIYGAYLMMKDKHERRKGRK